MSVVRIPLSLSVVNIYSVGCTHDSLGTLSVVRTTLPLVKFTLSVVHKTLSVVRTTLSVVLNISLLLRRFVFRMAEASAKRVTGDESQGTMGRVQTVPPSFPRTFSSKERRLGKRQVMYNRQSGAYNLQRKCLQPTEQYIQLTELMFNNRQNSTYNRQSSAYN